MELADLERICLEALELAPAARASYLDRACATSAIRREVESLLGQRTAAESFFQGTAAAEDYGGTGPYQVLEKLGEGGMGVVFHAHQTAPVVRDAALKIIRPGMASAALVARFQRERQALAVMDHPNIARVYDAGATTRGLPYLVMELVPGQSIVQFCESRALPLRDRVALMIPVCRAIQHAHTKGIIHRDIKPSNVLVPLYDGKPVPKIIDFGIAKAIEGAAPGMAGQTRTGVVIGTFEYVSPEQADAGARDVDARTDIYSLGALFYQMAAGRLPLENLNLEHCTYAELLRRVREENPPPAGAGELDWILAKALAKDRDQRYQSADAMAADLARYLAGEPVEAGPPSTLYRLRKLARKFRYVIAAAAVSFALLLAALGWMFIALREQRQVNEDSAALREVVRKIIIDRPAQLALIPNRTALRGQLMGDAEGALNVLSRDTRSDPTLEAEVAKADLAIGQAKGPYSAVGSEGDPAAAAPYVRRSLEIYRKLSKASPRDASLAAGKLDALAAWLHLQYRLNDRREARRAAAELLAEVQSLTPAIRVQVESQRYLSIAYLELGIIQFAEEQNAEAIQSHRLAVSTFLEHMPPGWLAEPARQEHLAHAERELAVTMLMGEGSSPEAENAARRGVDAVAQCSEPACRMRHAQSLGTLGEIEVASGETKAGTADLRRGIAGFETLSAEDPANAIFSNAAAQLRDYLALALRGSPEAVTLARKNVQLAAGADGALTRGHERFAVHRIALGAALTGAGQYAGAEAELRACLNQMRAWSLNYDLLWSALHELVLASEAQGDFAQQLAAARQAWDAARDSNPKTIGGRMLFALAARDLASATAHWPATAPADRVHARQLLDQWCAGLDPHRGTLVGALIAAPPAPAEVAALRNLLTR
ncbi:MAG TPA: serine/threonine-protein kinase [Bryobacteraceae bacterium]|jgi:hypothetical protein|nr:serine/threonine-protein kinase [Bryobacteraceae bacterium]